MFNAHEDFSEDVLRERLAPDRRLVNDVDFYSRGRAYEKRKMWAKALLHWRRAAAINPQRDTYYAAMARAYVQLGRYDQALDQMDAALQVSRTPDVWRPLHDLILETQRSATGPRANAQRRPTSG
jgi:tetratricopeptide (TPR) repeat protein